LCSFVTDIASNPDLQLHYRLNLEMIMANPSRTCKGQGISAVLVETNGTRAGWGWG